MGPNGASACFMGGSGRVDEGELTVLADKSDRRSGPRAKGVKPADDRAMGDALRSVYQQTVEEKVPDEFLDLLGKLD